ncbi:unnamed protein product [Peniophora sp. CBMAI 1063]|nr:unnamed protein product [Peniophora sp. CBMAI 1063]
MSQSAMPPASSSSPGARAPMPVPASQQQQQQQQQQHQGSPSSRGTSPAFDRNRTVRAQSMQAYATANAAAASSPPASQQAFPSKPTPPPGSTERPPPPQHALSQPNIQQVSSTTAPRNPHRHSAPLYNAFMPPGPEAFAMHPDIMAELELRAQGLVHAAASDITPNLAAGLGGIAYSGGASSSSVNVAGTSGERERAPELTRRGSTRDQAQQGYDQQQQQAYEYEMGRYAQQQAYEQQYLQYDREAYIPLPPAGRSPATPPPVQTTTRKAAPAYVPSPVATAPAKLPDAASQKRTDSGGKDPIQKGNKDSRSGSGQGQQGQGQQGQGTPELPVHEDDAEQDHILAERWPAGRTPSPVPSSDILPDALRRKDAQQISQGAQQQPQQIDGEDRSAGEDSHTPRSPVNSLPMHQSQAIAAMLNARHHPRRRLDSAASSAFGLPPSSEYGQTSEYMFAHPSEDPRWSHLFDDPEMAYYTGAFSNSPVSTNSRPGAPIPPTSAAPSPLPAHLQMNAARVAALRQAYSPAPMPTGSPYPFPFGHIPRGAGPSAGYAGTGTLDSMDAAAVQEQLAAQMRTYAANNGGLESVSTLSPRASPAPWPYPPGHNPWAYLQTSRVYGAHPLHPPPRRHALASDASIRSSPSHEPVQLPLMPTGRGAARVRRGSSLRPQANGATKGKAKRNLRPASTQPRDTSPEPSSSSGEETALESHVGRMSDEEHEDEVDDGVEGKGKGVMTSESDRPESTGESTAYAPGSGTGEDEWVDVSDDDTEDLLGIEFHPEFIGQPEKRRRRFEARWDALVRAFNELDRETDTPMVLLAAPAHTSKLHAHTSRALRRTRSSPTASSHMASVRRSFSLLAAERAPSAALPSLWETLSASSRAGTPSAPEMTQLLETALGSLAALGEMYRVREARWAEEMGRAEEERERVQLLMRQVLGAGAGGGGGMGFRNWSPFSVGSASSSTLGVNGMVNGASPGGGVNDWICMVNTLGSMYSMMHDVRFGAHD